MIAQHNTPHAHRPYKGYLLPVYSDSHLAEDGVQGWNPWLGALPPHPLSFQCSKQPGDSYKTIYGSQTETIAAQSFPNLKVASATLRERKSTIQNGMN
jgi:hypothetical protein